MYQPISAGSRSKLQCHYGEWVSLWFPLLSGRWFSPLACCRNSGVCLVAHGLKFLWGNGQGYSLRVFLILCDAQCGNGVATHNHVCAWGCLWVGRTGRCEGLIQCRSRCMQLVRHCCLWLFLPVWPIAVGVLVVSIWRSRLDSYDCFPPVYEAGVLRGRVFFFFFFMFVRNK